MHTTPDDSEYKPDDNIRSGIATLTWLAIFNTLLLAAMIAMYTFLRCPEPKQTSPLGSHSEGDVFEFE